MDLINKKVSYLILSGVFISIWIGIDDTDSSNGGCTTFIAFYLVKEFNLKYDFDLIGFPRLVRLNPNIPWKTRGNGAICLKIGKGKGEKTKIGEFNDSELFFYRKSEEKLFDKEELKDIISDSFERYSRIEDEKTNPGFVILDKKPDIKHYYKAVRQVVTLEETKKFLKRNNGFYKGFKNQRGLIGATASTAWKNKYDKTFELIKYRTEKNWGSKRFVDDKSVKKMDEKTKQTFDNYDYKNHHNRITPSSPCPILYGIRGDDYQELIKANSMVDSEQYKGWMIFESNQGTDDHLVKTKIFDIKPYMSVIVNGKVVTDPFTIKGGHVFFKIKDETGVIDSAAYEPTKEFRDIIRRLTIGDIVEVYGGVRDDNITVNLEKIKINDLVKKLVKVENPICPKCGKHMKSKGKNQGFKCINCKTKSDKPLIEEEKRSIKTGFYEVPVCARRHLSKPLKRY